MSLRRASAMPVPPAFDPLSATFATSYANVFAFMAVVAEGNFARAGQRLGIDRSAVSRSVKRLESRLGVRLLRRTTRSLSLTPEGELLYTHCQPGIEQIGQAFELMSELRDGPPRGTLHVSAELSFGRHVLAPLLRGFQERFPEVDLDLVLDDGPADFASGRVDLRFQRGPTAQGPLVARQVMPLDLVVCASPTYLRWQGRPATPADLAAHRCIGRRLSSGRLREWEFRDRGRAQRQRVNAWHVVNDDDLVVAAMRDGMGLGQVPGHLVRDLIGAGALKRCLDDRAPEVSGYELCYAPNARMPSRMRVFIDHVTTQLRAHS